MKQQQKILINYIKLMPYIKLLYCLLYILYILSNQKLIYNHYTNEITKISISYYVSYLISSNFQSVVLTHNCKLDRLLFYWTYRCKILSTNLSEKTEFITKNKECLTVTLINRSNVTLNIFFTYSFLTWIISPNNCV